MAVILSFSAVMPALQAVAINLEPAEITSADRRRTLLPELSESRQTTTEDETRPETRDTDTPAPMAENFEKTQTENSRWTVYIADRNPTAKTAAEYRVYTDASSLP